MDKLKKFIKKTSIINNKGIRNKSQRETKKLITNTSGSFTYTWIIKNFQELYNQKSLEYYYSDIFISPSINEQIGTIENSIETMEITETNENTPFTIVTNKIEHKWRLLLYPHGHRSKKAKSHISLYLSAIQRLSRLNCYRNVLEKQFTFNNEREATWGSVKFCEIETIFPNNLDSKFNLIRMEKVDLMIRIHFFENNENNYDLELLNIDILLKFGPSLKEYFNNERFRTLEDDELTFDTLVNIYTEADMREIEELIKVVIFRVAEMVNKDNWDDVLLLGWTTDNYWLKDQALIYIHSKWEELKDTERMKKKEQELETLETLETAINDDEGTFSVHQVHHSASNMYSQGSTSRDIDRIPKKSSIFSFLRGRTKSRPTTFSDISVEPSVIDNEDITMSNESDLRQSSHLEKPSLTKKFISGIKKLVTCS
ncbi:25909_t:CDS:2 [Gigaspora rosea]|nr:25909_t:CDS:2 [Gigaspora rosea]